MFMPNNEGFKELINTDADLNTIITSIITDMRDL